MMSHRCGVKKIVLLGSTGSIGQKALDVVRNNPSRFRITALAAGRFSDKFLEQIKEFKPKYVGVPAETGLASRFKNTEIVYGAEGLKFLASLKEADLIFNSVVGAVGVYPLISALVAKKRIALANKESLVAAGSYVSALEKNYPSPVSSLIIPVDSEHSAIFQCLEGRDRREINRLIITASGGPLYGKNFKKVSVSHTLNHPTWKMGRKITVDSATLMNKGLEVIEAHYLFNVPYDKISVLIHPQSIVHSMVEFIDGSTLAQLSPTDMLFAVQYAITYPKRLPVKRGYLKLEEIKTLKFIKPDFSKFPCFKIALEAGKAGGVMPAVMNAANEVAVDSFLNGRLKFEKIPAVITKTLERISNRRNPSLEEILSADSEARETAKQMIF